MNASLASGSVETRLPRLTGRWVLALRLICCLLAVTAAAVMAGSLYAGNGHPAILAIRTIKGIILIAVCAILLKRRRDDPVAALLSLAFLTWTITSSFDFASAGLLPMLLDRARFLLFALALLLFPDGRWRPAWTRHVAMASAVMFALGLAETMHFIGTRLFLPLAIGCIVAAVVGLVIRFRTAQSEAVRQQMKWIALGLVVGIGLILSARAGRAVTAEMRVLWEALFQIGIVVIALGFLISLLRYRLFDAETAISRSAVFAVLTIAIVATFAGTEATIEWVGQQYLGMGIGSNISAAMAAAVAAVLLNPLHGRISDWAEGRFQRDLAQLKRDLPDILEDLAATASPSQLGAIVLSRIALAVHSTWSGLIAPGGRIIAADGITLEDLRTWSRQVLDRDGRLLHHNRNGAQFPVRIELTCPLSGKSGWILIGPRPDGSVPGREDLEAIETLRPAIRRSMAWAMTRENANRTALRQSRSLRRDVAELRRGLENCQAGGGWWSRGGSNP